MVTFSQRLRSTFMPPASLEMSVAGRPGLAVYGAHFYRGGPAALQQKRLYPPRHLRCMEPDRLRPLLRLLLTPGMHSAAAARVLRRCGGEAGRVLAAPREVLSCVPGVGPALAAALDGAPASDAEADAEAARARDLGVALIAPGEAGYPWPLLRTFDPPPLLWMRGEWAVEDCLAVAVVGSRRAS